MSASSSRDRYRRPARRPAFRDPRPKMLIVCEGSITEPQYFEQFAGFHRNSLVKVEIAPAQGVPLTVVRAAKERRDKAISDAKRESDENVKIEFVWCVFDIDEHPNVPEAKSLAHQNNIKVAISNPCLNFGSCCTLGIALACCIDTPSNRCSGRSSLTTIRRSISRFLSMDMKRRSSAGQVFGKPRGPSRRARKKSQAPGVHELTESIIPKPPAPAPPISSKAP